MDTKFLSENLKDGIYMSRLDVKIETNLEVI
jgi:hypothetical protein